MKKLKVLFSPNLMKRWCINDAENLDLNPKGDNLTELDQWIKDLYQRMNIKMSNQKCSITFTNRKKTGITMQSKFNDIITVFFKC